jgi:hypothetical protein
MKLILPFTYFTLTLALLDDIIALAGDIVSPRRDDRLIPMTGQGPENDVDKYQPKYHGGYSVRYSN